MSMALTRIGLLAGLICLILAVLLRRYRQRAVSTPLISQSPKHAPANADNPYDSIKPLSPASSWDITPALQLRPFKPQYHLTMSIVNSTISELVQIDKTYLQRIMLRRELLETHREAVLACNDDAASSVLELHQWMFGTYLPSRFPSMFTILPAHQSKVSSPVLRNEVTDENILVVERDPVKALSNLGAHIDNDLLLLLPSSADNNGSPIYHLEAFITCFPNGFSIRSKLGLPLSAIHKPVPGYKEKLERSMDRYFAKLAVGTVVKRANWSVTTHDRLFTTTGNHLYQQDEATDSSDPADAEAKRRAYEENINAMKQDVTIDDCRLRVERQTLHRLPVSKAIVFGIRTYLYTLDEVKAGGDGPALADAIDGLSRGNVPDMMYYKRCVIWGDQVREYLRN